MLFFAGNSNAEVPLNSAGRFKSSPAAYASGPAFYSRLEYAGKNRAGFEFSAAMRSDERPNECFAITANAANKTGNPGGFGAGVVAIHTSQNLNLAVGTEVSGAGTSKGALLSKAGFEYTPITKKTAKFGFTLFMNFVNDMGRSISRLFGGADVSLGERVKLSAKKEGSDAAKVGADLSIGRLTPVVATDFQGNWEAGVGLERGNSKTPILMVSHNECMTIVSIAYHF